MTAAGLQPTGAEARAAFTLAADWFLSVLARVPSDAWDRPGLGEWTVKELAAHTTRALTTIEQYLAAAPAEVVLSGPVAYFRAAMAIPDVHTGVAERGRREATSLGDDPVAAIGESAERVRALVDATPGDTVCGSAVGGIALDDYLATRVVELTVHTTDLVAALGLDEQVPVPAAAVTLAILAGLAATRPDRTSVLRALTGRIDLPPGTTLLA
ncbi:MAG: maleylpyruvate isomerase family mycothiol-dependent enzyme [Acidimicrobiales bacterium]